MLVDLIVVTMLTATVVDCPRAAVAYVRNPEQQAAGQYSPADSVQRDSAFSTYDSRREMRSPLTISSTTKSLKLRIKPPAGMKFNRRYPFSLKVQSSDTLAVKIGKFVAGTAEKTINIPVTAAVGRAVIDIDAEAGYCEIGDDSRCLVGKAAIAIPVDVVEKGGAPFEMTLKLGEK